MHTLAEKIENLNLVKVARNPLGFVTALKRFFDLKKNKDQATTLKKLIQTDGSVGTKNILGVSPQSIAKLAPTSHNLQSVGGAYLGATDGADAYANIYNPNDTPNEPNIIDRILGLGTGALIGNPTLRKLSLPILSGNKKDLAKNLILPGKLALSSGVAAAPRVLEDTATKSKDLGQSIDGLKEVATLAHDLPKPEDVMNQAGEKVDHVMNQAGEKIDQLEGALRAPGEQIATAGKYLAPAGGALAGGLLGNVAGSLYSSDDEDEKERKKKERRARAISTLAGTTLGGLSGYALSGGFSNDGKSVA